MPLMQRFWISLVAGTISAAMLSCRFKPFMNGSLFFSDLCVSSAIDTEYVPEEDEEDDIVFGCWLFEMIAGLFD